MALSGEAISCYCRRRLFAFKMAHEIMLITSSLNTHHSWTACVHAHVSRACCQLCCIHESRPYTAVSSPCHKDDVTVTVSLRKRLICVNHIVFQCE